MTKTEVDYSNTIIYKITCKNSSCKELYIGYTTNFTQMKHVHKQICEYKKSSNYNNKLYKIIRENGGWDNWIMEIINCCNCKNKHEAIKKQEEQISLLHATLNSFSNSHIVNMVSFESKSVQDSYDNISSIYIQKNQEKATFRTEKATLITFDDTKVALGFCCKHCDYTTSKKSSYDKHLSTGKHLDKIKVAQGEEDKFTCKNCEKGYNSSGGLWKHKKTC